MKPAFAVMMLAFMGLFACSGKLDRYEYSRPEMGTIFRLVLYAPDPTAAKAAADAAFARVQQLNATLSDYIPISELSRLSDTAGSGQATPVSHDLWEMLEQSQRVARDTGGAFDITVGPAVQLWRRARRTGRMPEPVQLEGAMRAVGFKKLALDPGRRTARLLEPGMRLDLGGIAKGYAADEALRMLRKRGIRSALVAAGGDVVTGDSPPRKKGWVVQINALVQASEPGDQNADDRTPYILLRNAAVSTSGDAFQHVTIDGKRYSHILDPRTGLGLTTPMGVSVISRRGTISDAYATAAAVLGPVRGVQAIDRLPGAAAIMVLVDESGKIRKFRSRRFERLKFLSP